MHPNPSADQLRSRLSSTERDAYSDFDHFYRDDDSNEWILNGNSLPQKRNREIFTWIDRAMRGRTHCPFCNSNLIGSDTFEYYDDLAGESVVVDDEANADGMCVHGTLAVCQRCWYWHWFSGGTKGRIVVWDASVGKLRSFEPKAPEGCFQELAIWLRRDPKRWNSLDPKVLEKFVADIWRQNYAHAEVIHVGKPKDGGTDVLFIDSSERQWLIQVKRRKDSRKGEGVLTLRHLLGTMVTYPSKHGIVVSTADHFSTYALNERKRAADAGLTVELIDRGRLDRMLQGYHPAFPWLKFLEVNHPSHAESYAQRGFGPENRTRPVKDTYTIDMFANSN